MDVSIGEAEELDTVGLLLQPIQLGSAGCIVYDKSIFFFFFFFLHLLQLLYCFYGCFLLSNE